MKPFYLRRVNDHYYSILIDKLMILIIILFHFIAMQIGAELGRILQEPDVTKSIRNRFQGGWRESLLTVVRRSDNEEVMAIMEEAEGVDISDEKG